MPRKASAPSSKNASRNGRINKNRHPEEARRRRLAGWSHRQPWFETRQEALLTMRRHCFRIWFHMNHDAYPDEYIRGILNGVKSIAMVGASPVNVRPSYFAFKYLAQRGYDMIPVNPGHVGKSLLGRPFVASLLDIDRPVDMVDIFRHSRHVMPVVDEAL